MFGAYSAELQNLVWLCWTTVAVFAFLILTMDLLFTDDSSFIYDPDPEVVIDYFEKQCLVLKRTNSICFRRDAKIALSPFSPQNFSELASTN